MKQKKREIDPKLLESVLVVGKNVLKLAEKKMEDFLKDESLNIVENQFHASVWEVLKTYIISAKSNAPKNTGKVVKKEEEKVDIEEEEDHNDPVIVITPETAHLTMEK